MPACTESPFAPPGRKRPLNPCFPRHRHLFRIGWPETKIGYFHGQLKYDLWDGTLIEDKRDEAGTFYRRNRYYDPLTGRFTQEDPIGLAEGLNLYGFAAGDPVNLSDPFGLCVPAWVCQIILDMTPVRARGERSDVVIDRGVLYQEVRSGGTRSWRNNNPGNLEQGTFVCAMVQ